MPLAIISVYETSSAVSENEVEARITLIADKPVHGDVIVNYTIEGSATSGEDFNAPGSITIPSGASEIEIVIDLLDDTDFEFDPEIDDYFGESLTVQLSGVTGNGKLAQLPEALTHNLIILENDPAPKSLTIELAWDSGDGTPGDVDMDMFIFRIEDEGTVLLAGSAKIGTDFEGIVITSPAPDAVYGLAYRYFEGSSDNLTISVKFTVENGALDDLGGSEKIFTAQYTQANVNGDVSPNATVQIVQTFQKQGLNYSGFSEIDVPDSGSRSRNIWGAAGTRGDVQTKSIY